MKLSIIIPVFNEEKSIQRLISTLTSLKTPGVKKEIIVIDDHSTDRTSVKLQKFLHDSKIKVLTHEENQGKGAAIKTGMQFATGDYLIVQDADFEYDPRDIGPMLTFARIYPEAVIYGSRYLGTHVDTYFHKMGNWFVTCVTNLLFQSRLTDMETCYKLIPKKIYKKLNIQSNRFNFEPEVTAKILRMSYKIIEVPISYHKRGFYEGKKLRWWKDGISALWTLIKYRL